MASARRVRHVPRVYEIRVRGALGPMLLAAFPDMTARRVGPDTVLGGVLADPAAVYGVIHRLEAFALELVEVRSSSDPRRARIGEAAH